jgi:hypothetical protein
MAISAKPFVPPVPAFGPESVAHIRRQAEELELLNAPEEEEETPSDLSPTSTGTYAGAGSYF